MAGFAFMLKKLADKPTPKPKPVQLRMCLSCNGWGCKKCKGKGYR